MTIDRVPGVFPVLDWDKDAMKTSSEHFSSLTGSDPDCLPFAWSKAATQKSGDHVEFETESSYGRRKSRYQGVRVKNPVKELIMQRRQDELQSPCTQAKKMFCGTELENFLDFMPQKQFSPQATEATRCPMTQYPPPQDQITVVDHDTSSEQSMCNGYFIPSPMETHTSLAPRNHVSTGHQVSFFEWQIQQEEKKLAGLSPLELSTKDDDGDTFLHIAVAQGKRALAYVLARKMSALDMLDIKEKNKQSSFQVSVAADQHLIAQDLLSLGASLNTTDIWGRSPLHVCAEKGHLLALQAIQRSRQSDGQEVKTEVINYDGFTPLHVAVLSHNSVVRALRSLGKSSSSHFTLMQRKKLLGECVCTLLQMGATIETKDCKSGRTVLHMAAVEANNDLLQLFLKQPNHLSVINAKAFNGNTALHIASALQARQEQVDTVRLLLRRGADPSSRNLDNEQPLQLVPGGPLGDRVRWILKGKGAINPA